MWMILAQATQSVEVTVQGPWVEFWLSIFLPMGPILGALIAWYLKQLLAKVKEEREKGNLEAGSLLVNRLKTYLLDTAITIAENQFPVLAKDVLEGRIKTADDVRRVMDGWSKVLKEKAKNHFESQGVKLDEWLPEESLNDLIRGAADQASPFPGMVTANVVTQPRVAKDLLDRGVTYVRDNYSEYRADFNNINLDPDVKKVVDREQKDPSKS